MHRSAVQNSLNAHNDVRYMDAEQHFKYYYFNVRDSETLKMLHLQLGTVAIKLTLSILMCNNWNEVK